MQARASARRFIIRPKSDYKNPNCEDVSTSSDNYLAYRIRNLQAASRVSPRLCASLLCSQCYLLCSTLSALFSYPALMEGRHGDAKGMSF